MDEVMYAGGKNADNVSYYLYNGQSYWTMSPSDWSGSGYAGIFRVDYGGFLGGYYVNNTYGLRPVINLRSDVTFSGGNGTQSSPYVVQ